MLIPLDQIDPPANPLRRVANPEADASLTASIAARGVLTPILVTRAGNRYRLLDGAARLRCAQAAGVPTIPAEITDTLSPEAEQAATAAVNIVRATVAPVDQWRAIVAMQAAGSTLANATASLGLSEQMGRRLDHLGRLHPDMLALIEAAGMPEHRHLRVIAQASHKQQKAALKSTRATAALRTQLAGALPDWRPTQAQFGAAGPTPRDAAADDDGDEREEEPAND